MGESCAGRCESFRTSFCEANSVTADEAVFAMKKGGGGGAVGVRTLTVEVATYTEFRDGGGSGGETSRDFRGTLLHGSFPTAKTMQLCDALRDVER